MSIKTFNRTRFILAALAVMIPITAKAFIVTVDSIPEQLYGYPMTIKSWLDNRTLDSLQVKSSHAELRGQVKETELGSLNFSFEVPGGVCTNYKLIIFAPGTDTIKAIIKNYEICDVKISGGSDLNAKMQAIDKHVKSILSSPDSTVSYLISTFKENKNNPLGVLLLSSLQIIISAEEWLEFYDSLSPAIKQYPLMTDIAKTLRVTLMTKEGTMFKNLDCLLPDGTPAQLSDYVGKGKYVLVDFWATWCGPCRAEAANVLMPLYEKYKDDERFMILGVLVSDSMESYNLHKDSLNYPWPQLIDESHTAGTAYGFQSIPYLILFAPDGTVLRRDIRGAAIDEAIAAALDQD